LTYICGLILAGVYLHIPYCRQACAYCDFFFSTSLRTMPALVQAMCEEIGQRAGYLHEKSLDSIYIGGGTPSLLSQDQLTGLFGELARHFTWEKNAEITIEANPDDITSHALDTWRHVGINRISIGLQSFNNEELKWMNRAHDAREGIDSVKRAQDKGFTNLSVDLIYGSKFQDLKNWEQTLNTTIGLEVAHISSYNLTIEKKTGLGVAFSRGLEPGVSEELSSAEFLLMTDLLSSTGYEHYEISNFAKPGRQAVHNGNYWKQRPYLGIGPSAHSFDGESRQWNVSNNNAYITAMRTRTPFFEKEVLTSRDRYNEYVLTRLRTSWGCDVTELGRMFGEPALVHFLSQAGLKREMFEVSGSQYRLRKEARLLADGIASDLFL
jgi:oxygen-independent coproporphyrinogen III oxidase